MAVVIEEDEAAEEKEEEEARWCAPRGSDAPWRVSLLAVVLVRAIETLAVGASLLLTSAEAAAACLFAWRRCSIVIFLCVSALLVGG